MREVDTDCQKCLGSSSPCQWDTLLSEVMAVVNSRPLNVYAINDPTSPPPLTPNHLLTMKTKLVLPPPGVFHRQDLYLKKHWRRVQYLSDEFWCHWKREYIHVLQERQKWTTSRRDLIADDVVLIKDENAPRGQWKLARVIKVYPDDDGHVRKVKLKQSEGQTLERPVQKLVLILKKEEQEIC